MEREQEGGGKVEEKGSRRRKAGTMTKPATTIGVAEEAAIASAGDNRACFNGRSQKNEHNGNTRTGSRNGASSKKGPFFNGGRLGQELLCMRGIQAHGPSLQKLELEGKSSRE